jgi:hypothetical protein
VNALDPRRGAALKVADCVAERGNASLVGHCSLAASPASPASEAGGATDMVVPEQFEQTSPWQVQGCSHATTASRVTDPLTASSARPTPESLAALGRGRRPTPRVSASQIRRVPEPAPTPEPGYRSSFSLPPKRAPGAGAPPEACVAAARTSNPTSHPSGLPPRLPTGCIGRIVALPSRFATREVGSECVSGRPSPRP